MKKRVMITGLLFVIFTLMLSGCMHMATGLAEATTPVSPNQYKILGHATGQSQYTSIFMIIPLGTPDYDTAIRDAVKKFPEGKALINVRSYSTSLYLYFVSIHTLTVEGDVVTY